MIVLAVAKVLLLLKNDTRKRIIEELHSVHTTIKLSTLARACALKSSPPPAKIYSSARMRATMLIIMPMMTAPIMVAADNVFVADRGCGKVFCDFLFPVLNHNAISTHSRSHRGNGKQPCHNPAVHKKANARNIAHAARPDIAEEKA